MINIINLSTQSPIQIQARWCDSFFSRLKGFTFRKNIEPSEGLVLVEKRDSRLDTAIHMFFVFTDLSVTWVNTDMTVIDSVIAKAWHPFYAATKPARYVIETNTKLHGYFKTGDKVSFEKV